jgi:hypothetical protein
MRGSIRTGEIKNDIELVGFGLHAARSEATDIRAYLLDYEHITVDKWGALLPTRCMAIEELVK